MEIFAKDVLQPTIFQPHLQKLALYARLLLPTALTAIMKLLVHYVIPAIYLLYVTLAILQITISQAQAHLPAAHAPLHSVTALLVP